MCTSTTYLNGNFLDTIALLPKARSVLLKDKIYFEYLWSPALIILQLYDLYSLVKSI